MSDTDAAPNPSVVVLGPVGRDLVLFVDDLPDAGTSGQVLWRREVLGGKAANQAVGLARLGVAVALVGAVGQDAVGDDVLAQARADGIDTSCVVRRAGTSTPLIVELLDEQHRWRYLEDVPEPARLTATDVRAARATIARASFAVVQLQQPTATAVIAADLARGSGARVVLDGAPTAAGRKDLLELAHVLRADGHEAELLTGTSLGDERDALRAAENLLKQGPELIVLAVEGAGNLFAWPDGNAFFPVDKVTPFDTTGAGDALVAGLVAALDRGLAAPEAARWAVAASSLTIEHPGGRPRLTLDTLLERADRQTAHTIH